MIQDSSKLENKKVSFFEERTIDWDRDKRAIRMIDQTLLPLELRFVECSTVEETVEAIQSLRVRGAPAIGVCGAMGVALSVSKANASTKQELLREIETDCIALKSARPTAINLEWGVDKVLDFIKSSLPEHLESDDYKGNVVGFVMHLADDDVVRNKKLSELGSKLFRTGDSVLTHCN